MTKFEPKTEPELRVYGWNGKSGYMPDLLGVVRTPADAEAVIQNHRGTAGNGYIFWIGGPLYALEVITKKEQA